MLVFIPLTPDELHRLHADAATGLDAIAATPALFDSLGYTDDSYTEDAEYAALTYASVVSLTRGSRRLVAVASASEVDDRDDPEGFGLVRVRRLQWSQVSALFVGDPDDGERESAAAEAVSGEPLEAAWEAPAVVELVEETDLMWFGPDEVAEVVALASA